MFCTIIVCVHMEILVALYPSKVCHVPPPMLSRGNEVPTLCSSVPVLYYTVIVSQPLGHRRVESGGAQCTYSISIHHVKWL